MSAKSDIEWTDASWTAIRARVKENAGEIAAAKGYSSLVQIATKMQGHVGPHCEKISLGCERCYSEHANCRCLPHNGTGLPFDRRSRDLVDVFVDEKILTEPLRWRKPRKVFVCSQTDLFADFVTDEMIDQIFAVMALSYHMEWTEERGNIREARHTFQVLTKRPERMRARIEAILGSISSDDWFSIPVVRHAVDISRRRGDQLPGNAAIPVVQWISDGMPGLWLGVSVESRDYLERIDHLRQTPAAVRFLSLEPLLEDLGDISCYLMDCCPECGKCVRKGWRDCPSPTPNCEGRPSGGIDWVIVGGESGPGARPMHPDCVRGIRDQCVAAGVPFFFKQWGEWAPAGPIDHDDEYAGGEAFQSISGGMASVTMAQRQPGNYRRLGEVMLERVSKKKAGRELDGRTWDEMPEVRSGR